MSEKINKRSDAEWILKFIGRDLLQTRNRS